jgi:hypothetical protein
VDVDFASQVALRFLLKLQFLVDEGLDKNEIVHVLNADVIVFIDKSSLTNVVPDHCDNILVVSSGHFVSLELFIELVDEFFSQVIWLDFLSCLEVIVLDLDILDSVFQCLSALGFRLRVYRLGSVNILIFELLELCSDLLILKQLNSF